MKRIKPWLMAGAGVLLASFIIQQFRLFTAAAVTVEPGKVSEFVMARATVIPRDGSANVHTRIDGRVLTVHVQEGETVQQGQLLAEIEAEVLDADLQRAEAERREVVATHEAIAQGARAQEREALAAEVKAARETLQLARQKAERELKMFGSGASARASRDDALREADIARAKYEQAQHRYDLAMDGGNPHEVRAAQEKVAAAEAALQKTQHQKKWSRIEAPIAGVVLGRHIDPGDTLVVYSGLETPALFEIADISRKEVRIEIEEGDVPKIRAGQSLTLTLPLGENRIGQGRIVRLGCKVQQRTIGGDPSNIRADSLVLPVFAELAADTAKQLPVGQRLDARIEIETEPVVARLPRKAIAIREGLAMVDVRGFMGRDALPVRLGRADDEFVEVAGIQVGTQVLLQ